MAYIPPRIPEEYTCPSCEGYFIGKLHNCGQDIDHEEFICPHCGARLKIKDGFIKQILKALSIAVLATVSVALYIGLSLLLFLVNYFLGFLFAICAPILLIKKFCRPYTGRYDKRYLAEVDDKKKP